MRTLLALAVLALCGGCNMTTIYITQHGDGEINVEAPMSAEKKLEVNPEFKIGFVP